MMKFFIVIGMITSLWICFYTERLPSKVYPRVSVLRLGCDAKITCTSDEEVQWFFNGGPLPRNAFPCQNCTLGLFYIVIKSIQKANEGIYTCEGTDYDLGYDFYSVGKLHIKGKECIFYDYIRAWGIIFRCTILD